MILGKNAQNVQKITDLIKENPRPTLLELEQDTGISKTTIGRIVTKDLKLKKTPAKFIPRFLTNEQKLCRLATCENMLEMTRTDPEWKDKIITGDETWVYDYDPETKRQYAEWRGQDIAPNDFFLFPKLKAVLKGRHFDTRDDIIEKSLLALKSIPKELYKNCFDNLGKRWRCLRALEHFYWSIALECMDILDDTLPSVICRNEQLGTQDKSPLDKWTPVEKETHTGQKWEADDIRMVRFVERPKQTNEMWAIDLINKVPPKPMKNRVVSCDGGGGALGHPKVFINLDQPGNHTCGYCGLRFYKEDHH
ncbi:NDUFS6 [Cordylochernes scorpioides]|uniref:NDUFS6 n=1 Tax=Cordylochernes scorpioides TaxID=51811 RepID=A0ABY6KD95_9ARAC|nr:NDUFS6 [Cordylochernes scorpioides]